MTDEDLLPPLPRRRRPLAAAAIILGVLGIAAVSAAVLASVVSTPSAASPTDAAPAPPHATGTALATPAAPPATERPVSELADPGWVSRIATESGIPARALAAYAGASLAVKATHPDCRLGWNTLAGIGFVESEHGTIHGSAIGVDGVASPPIIGIPLDGNGTNPVPDTDRGALDGDTRWDRAVGPMQFIPDTWNTYAQDGDRDGVRDPHNIDDAALTAATYLCTAAGDLSTARNWIAALHAYNPSVEYNNRVADAANHYATFE